MKKTILLSTIITTSVCTGIYAKENNNIIKKIGIVNPITIYQSAPQGEEKIQELKIQLKPKKDKLQKQQEEILQEKQQLQNDAPSMTIENIKKRQAKNNQEENQFQKELMEFQKNSMQQEQKIAQTFQEDFNKSIDEIASIETYDLILSSHATAYVSPKLNFDLTDSIIEKMKEINAISTNKKSNADYDIKNIKNEIQE